MKSTLATILLFLSCSASGGPGFGWKLTDDYARARAKLREASILAEQIAMQPRCRSRLSALPAWPAGRVPVKPVAYWPDGNNPRVARTMWRNEGKGWEAIPPRIEVLEWWILKMNTESLANTLIHEMVHAAAWTAFEGLDKDEHKRALDEYEARAQDISRICMQAL